MADAHTIAVFADKPAQAAYLADLARVGGLAVVKDATAASLLVIAGNNAFPEFKGPIFRIALEEIIDPTVRVLKAPLRAASLIEAIEKQLQSLLSLPTLLPIGDAALDVRQGLWIRHEEISRLTEKEVAILVFLHKSDGQSVTREALLSHVWDYADGVETHTLETHIYRLRQKIEKDPANPKILLTQEDGYRISP